MHTQIKFKIKKVSMGLILIGMSYLALADISALDAMDLELRAEDIRKELNISTPSKHDKELAKIRSELNLDFDTSSKDALLGNNKADSVQPLGGVKEGKSITDNISSAFSSMKAHLTLDKETQKKYSFSNSIESFYDVIDLEKGKDFDVLSIFSFNEVAKKTEMNIPIFSDVQSATTNMYKGMKHSGQSAELLSGMMYNSSKVYNTMFGLFDDSPFNIFDGEDKKKSLIFDIFD
ncbi:hypothetical protein MNB_SV-13-403 [hydrothermal vent metagenome]|uniref:Uncharacterized protein n=1 Tax=hydrothermal vent metagenome TaxID=652676 RepID=A0A1W1CY29_9ZZZZ